MKKLLTLLLLSTFSIPSMAQTTEEIEAEISRRKQEIQSLTLQNTNYDLKLQEKQKEQAEAEKNLKALQAKRAQSEEACKSISESDLKLIAGLSGGTVAMSFVGAGAGTFKNIVDAKYNKDKTDNENENEPQEPKQTLQKASTLDKAINIGTTVTSAGSTVTSAIALSKVSGLKDDIERCVNSFK
ncbi:hypothetical protein HDR59_04075 [bacterium]|nr:hypothetical protein [bacterium]